MLRINKNTPIQKERKSSYSLNLNFEDLKNDYIKFTYDEDLIKELEGFKYNKLIKEHLKYNSEDVEFISKLFGYVKD